MRTLFIPSLISALLLTGLTLTAGVGKQTQAASENPTSSNSFSYGYVYTSQLSDLTAARDRTAYALLNHALLNQSRASEAVPGLQRELAENPGSLPAYVGLMQAEPERWPGEIKKLQEKIARQRVIHEDPAPADLFKLGTLLYYQREHGPILPPHPGLDKQELEARTLLEEAWGHDNTPIIGLMLMESLITAGQSSAPANKKMTLVVILRQLVKNLAGPRIYAEYLRAESDNWESEPPSVARVPKKNLRPLLAVMASFHSLYGQRSGILKVINGKQVMIDFPVPAPQLAQEHYLDKWYHIIKAALTT